MYGQFFVIFALILTGYILRKMGIVSDAMNEGLNKFIVYFSFPCFIFNKVAGLDMSAQLLSEFLMVFGLSCVLFLISGLYAWAYGKLRRFPREIAGVAELEVVFSNNAFMGFPIAFIFFGEKGLLFMLANNIAMSVMLFSYGLLVLRRGDKGYRFSISSMLRCFANPNTLALVAGIVFYACGIHLPEAVKSYLVYMGNVCTPMSMVFIGSTLVGNSITQILKEPIVMESSINRNIVVPILTYLMLGFTPLPKMVIAMLVFANCFPAAAAPILLAETEGKETGLACRILVTSTVLSIVTLPLAVNLINLLILHI